MEKIITAERQFQISPWLRIVLPVLTEILEKDKKIIFNELELSKKLLPFDPEIDITTVIDAAIYAGVIIAKKEGEIFYISLPKTKKKKSKKIPPDDIQEVFDFWRKTLNHPRSRLDAKRYSKIEESLKTGYTVDDLKKSIIGCSLTPHNMGKNSTGSVYNGINIILKDSDQIDRFIRNCDRPPNNNQDDFDGITEWLNEK